MRKSLQNTVTESYGDPDECEDDHKNCPEYSPERTDDDGDQIVPDIGFPCILHQVEKIHNKQRKEADYRVNNQMYDILDDENRDRHEDNDDQDEESYANERHLPSNILSHKLRFRSFRVNNPSG